ncbi:hypothetical protein CDL60_18980 [Roseateles noduli]|nr:hypothetical protein CDL60_18980 [Roseateles noduli]
MFNSQVLEIAIGLVFVYLIASLLAATVREFIESVLKTRAVQLERGLRLLLDDPTGRQTAARLFAHPQIFGLFDGVYDPGKLTGFLRFWRKSETLVDGAVDATKALRLPFGSKLPSYIPSRNFALALLDMLARHDGDAPGAASADQARTMEILLANANALAPSRLRDALLVALNEAQGDFDRARTSLEAWFDSNMDRVSGWYKRESQVVLLVIGLLSAAAFNIDTIAITRQLASNNTVRAQVVLQAEAMASRLDPGTTVSDEDRQNALSEATKGLGDLIGWRQKLPDDWRLCEAVVGWILTGLAISLGAPFWFDLLNKMMVVRSTVKPFEKSPAEGSEDRRGATPPAEKLEPVPASPPAGGGVAGAPPVPDGAPPGKPKGSVRLAIEEAASLTGLTLLIDGQSATLPSNGLVELPLTMGEDHHLELKATGAGGQPVSWVQVVRVTLDDDAQAIEAELS